MASGRHACQDFAKEALAEIYGTPKDAEVCEYLNITVCNATVDADEFTIGIYSPSSHHFSEPIVIPVNHTNYEVTNSTGAAVPFDRVRRSSF